VNQLSEILGEKGRQVLEIEADASVFEAVKQMVEANVGSLLKRNGRSDLQVCEPA
jgi:predicted transcriptional regulator